MLYLYISGNKFGYPLVDRNINDAAECVKDTLAACISRTDPELPKALRKCMIGEITEEQAIKFDRLFCNSACYCATVWIEENENGSVHIFQNSHDMIQRGEEDWATFHICEREDCNWQQIHDNRPRNISTCGKCEDYVDDLYKSLPKGKMYTINDFIKEDNEYYLLDIKGISKWERFHKRGLFPRNKFGREQIISLIKDYDLNGEEYHAYSDDGSIVTYSIALDLHIEIEIYNYDKEINQKINDLRENQGYKSI